MHNYFEIKYFENKITEKIPINYFYFQNCQKTNSR